MSETSATAASAEAPETSGMTPCCLVWCRSDHTGDRVFDALHEGPVAKAVCSPSGSESTIEMARAAVTVIAETPEEFQDGPFVCVDGYLEALELDLHGVDAYIAGLERYLVDLRILRRGFAEILARPVQATTDGDLPLAERTSPCTTWCVGAERDENGRPAVHPMDRFHCSDPDTVALHLEHDGEVELSLEQGAFSHQPEVALTVHNHRDSLYVKVALDEAKLIAARLDALATQAERHASPASLPPLPEVLDSVGAQVFEDGSLSRDSSGYTLGKLDEGGHVLVVVPRGLSPEGREELVRQRLSHLAYQARCAAEAAPGAGPEAPLPSAA